MDISASSPVPCSTSGSRYRVEEAARRIESIDAIINNDPDVVKASSELQKSRNAHDVVDLTAFRCTLAVDSLSERTTLFASMLQKGVSLR
jgi:hypothetical protein